MRRLLAVTLLVFGLVASCVPLATTPVAQAYPGCYYSYYGCYLGPGWYGGRYWYGGPWFGWSGNNMSDRLMDRVGGCVVPASTGAC